MVAVCLQLRTIAHETYTHPLYPIISMAHNYLLIVIPGAFETANQSRTHIIKVDLLLRGKQHTATCLEL